MHWIHVLNQYQTKHYSVCKKERMSNEDFKPINRNSAYRMIPYM